MLPHGATSPEPRNLDIPLISIQPSSQPPGTTSVGGAEPRVPHLRLNSPPDGDDEAGSYVVTNGSPKVGGFVKRDPPFARAGGWSTEVDIIGVPAIGGDPEQTWTPGPARFQDDPGGPPRKSQVGLALMSMTPVSPGISSHTPRSYTQRTLTGKQEPAWLTRGIRNRRDMQKARVLLYDHGEPEDEDTLKLLASKLIRSLEDLRRNENENRPIFFICHSTGGIVAKMALVEAQRSKNPILGDCYGITFFATPHRGSSYLSMPDFAHNIADIMHLSRPIPKRIAKQLKLDSHVLKAINSDFRNVATELQVWSFFETIDSDLTNSDLVESERFPFHAPITSIKSALLNLRHEVVYPLPSDHTHCASFGEGSIQTKDAYLNELAEAIKKAAELNKLKHTELNLEEHVKVEVNGFYEGTVLNSNNEKPIRVWSTCRSLSDFLRHGPAQLLKERLAENTAQPRETQYMRHNSRAASLLATGFGSIATSEVPQTSKSKGHRFSIGSESLKAAGLQVPRASGSSTVASIQPTTGMISTEPEAHPSLKGAELPTTPESHTSKSPSSVAESQLSPAGASLTRVDGFGTDYGFPFVPPFKTNVFKQAEDDHALTNLKRREPELLAAASVPSSAPHNPLGILVDDTRTSLSFVGSTGLSSTNRLSINRSRRHSEAPPSKGYIRPRLPPREALTYRERRGSEGAMAPVSFLKPDISHQKLVWVHVPFNNPVWVKSVLERIGVEKSRDYHSRILSVEHWKSKHVRGRHTEHHACFMKPTCSLIGADLTSPPTSPRKGSLGPTGPIQMCLYVPYLHFDTYKMLVRRRQLVKRRLQQGRSRPVPQSIAKEPLEFKVMWQFLGHDPPINSRRTLDQFGYPSLLDTRARDDDQMLYKMTKQRCSHAEELLTQGSYASEISTRKIRTNSTRQGHENEVDTEQEPRFETAGSDNEGETDAEAESDSDDILDGNVLMVDQLWLWIVDEATTVTFFPRKEPLATDGRLYQQADLRNSIFNEVNADLTSRCENSFDLAALVAFHAVTVLFERSSHPDLEVFRTFEEAISILTEKMTNSFKQFRARGFRDKAADYHGVRSTNIRAKHKREGALAEKQNRENTSALLELRDIEDELHTLEGLFENQLATIKLMIGYYSREDLKTLTTNALIFLSQAEAKLTEYSNQAFKMIESVKSTRDDFDKLLQMVQRQAQVDEVRLARLQADLASAQSRSVMIFTIFTVIFLPLTFFTGLFGMNVQEWGGSNFIRLRTIGIISIPTSVAIITIALIIAWSTRVRRNYNAFSRRTRAEFIATRKSLGTLLASLRAGAPLSSADVRRDTFREKIERKRLAKEAKKDASLLDDDFWESHITGRESNYRVPPQNRKSVSLARRKMVEKEEDRATK